ncbi:hypothetical protein KSP35_10025 [Aquihabitans sp. G128]|uniref:hypothetical protein n=1 Tax=Aquihabitans sp. G128 TaxID=2849779 RepID=UPI001C24FB1D|nr:hypothetical protein [Aquihabitans sp. G128]QXC63081.1 hypothetical protein KSP35_10025 [Aquihabitans sp. G128]
MGLVVALFGIVVLVAVAGVVLAGVLALRGKANFERDAQLVPGMASRAPTSWAGSHDPEARLHRRLRDAMRALAANQAFDDDGSLLDLRVELQQQAVGLDDQLVATAALPLELRTEPLERIGGAIATIEQAVADLAGSSAAEAAADLSRVLDDVRTRTGLVAQAREALDALGPLPDTEAPSTGTAAGPTGSAPEPPTTQPATSPPAAAPSAPAPPVVPTEPPAGQTWPPQAPPSGS